MALPGPAKADLVACMLHRPLSGHQSFLTDPIYACSHRGHGKALPGIAKMAVFIALKRPGPPTKQVLINVDQILMVQPGQGSGSAILFGREHLVAFEEDVPTVIRRIQVGPYIRDDGVPTTPKLASSNASVIDPA
jgi:hypothetical protein